MSINEAYWAMVNNFRVLYGTVTRLPFEEAARQDRQNKQDGFVAPVRDMRQYIAAPRPSGPQYDGRQARSHCKKNMQ